MTIIPKVYDCRDISTSLSLTKNTFDKRTYFLTTFLLLLETNPEEFLG